MDNNYEKIKIKTYSQLIDEFVLHNNYPGYIFRGHQRSEWTLKPSFFRLSQINEANGLILLNRHLEKFKVFIRGRIANSQNLTENEIWSVGQHYGLYTPLLDWTASPYIALFFACKADNSDESDHTLYCLNTNEINKLLARKVSSEIDPDSEIIGTMENRFALAKYFKDEDKRLITGQITIDYIMNNKIVSEEYKNILSNIINENISIINPRIDNNPRLLSQRGLFTRTYITQSIEDIVKNTDWGCDEIILYQYLIDNKISKEIIENLNAMNINDLSLFPDLQGTSGYCNYKLIKESSIGDVNITLLNIDNVWK